MVVVLGLAVQDLGTAAHIGHGLVLGVPTHNSEALVSGHHGAQQHPVAGLKNMKWQYFLGEEHHIGQGKQRQLPYGQLAHGLNRRCIVILEKMPLPRVGVTGAPVAVSDWVGRITRDWAQSLTSISTPLGRSSFISASMVFAEGL